MSIFSFVREYLHILYASIVASSFIATMLANSGIVSFSGTYDFHVLMLIFLVMGFVFGSAYIFFKCRYRYETFHAYNILNLCTCFFADINDDSPNVELQEKYKRVQSIC